MSMLCMSICQRASASCVGSASSLGKSLDFSPANCLWHQDSSCVPDGLLECIAAVIPSVSFWMESICISAMAWISDLVGPMLGADPNDLVGRMLGADPNDGVVGESRAAAVQSSVDATSSSCREAVRAKSPHMWGSGPNSGS